MPKRITAFLTILAAVTLLAANDISLFSDHSAVEYGYSCTLTWSSPGADAYLFGVGRVAGSGSVQVRPEESMDYSLIVQDGHSVRFATTHVDLLGKKGGLSTFPDPDDFRQGLKSFKKSANYLDFVQQVASDRVAT
jgi:hypothetical protein